MDLTGRATPEPHLHSLARLERLNEESAALLRHRVEAESEERRRIAAGIHDDSIQVITSAGMVIDLLKDRLNDPQDQELARQARSLVSDAIARLRTLVFELRSLELADAGLTPAIRLLLKEASIDSGFDFSLVNETSQRLEEDEIYIVYQIIQESIVNIRKHAQATHVEVRLVDEDGGLRITVSDDGCGFDPLAARHPHHFGLSDMRDRAEVIGATLTMTSAPGKGTVVTLHIPASRGGVVPPRDK